MKKSLALIITLSVIHLASNLCNAVEYEIIDLGNLGMSKSEAYGINNKGQIVGCSSTVDDYGHAFLWENGAMTDLNPQLGNPSGSFAQGINDAGQIFGRKDYYTWLLDIDNSLRTVSGQYDEAHGMNGNGTVVGRTVINTYGDIRACTFDFVNRTAIELNLSYNSEAHAINNNGLITGWADKDGKHQGFLYDNGLFTYFGPSLGDHTYAYGINDSGQIVGHSGGQVFLYDNGVMTGLGINGHGRGINNKSQIVGHFDSHAYLYDNGVITDLGTLPGHTSSIAYAINDNGWIVGRSAVGDGHSWNAVLWKPIPEPATLLLLTLGVPMLSGLRRKR